MAILFRALIYFIDLIYPPCCLICGNSCNKIWCDRCKNLLYSNAKFAIKSNYDKKLYFDKQIYIFLYKDIIRKLILDYKFREKSYLYKIFSEIIIKNEKICRILKSYDIIIPVPIHKKRKKQRGYNQSELIARDIAFEIENLKIENKVIIKNINNKQQGLLNKTERIKNVKNVYQIENVEKIKNKRIILFDDIYTTGSTVNEISRILKQNGAKEILVVTLAKD